MAVWLSAISDLLINLSAGWFGAAIIVPITTRKPKFKPLGLIFNFLLGILTLLIGVFLRSLL